METKDKILYFVLRMSIGSLNYFVLKAPRTKLAKPRHQVFNVAKFPGQGDDKVSFQIQLYISICSIRHNGM